MTGLVLYPLLCAALYYLFARATLTEPLSSRYPDWLASFLACSACSGFWYGLGCAAVGAWQEWSFVGLAPRSPVTAIGCGLCAVVWTPLVSALHVKALYYLQNDPDTGPDDDPAPTEGSM
jgi:hypothetical protein